MSLIGACAFMYVFGFSIDNISLLAITLSVGFVVDDAIVMLENITRHIEGGMRPFDAALKGSKEIAFTILSITFSLVAVFIPVLLMSGVVGRVFHEFAVTITVAILVSGFVSLTLTPMLCARILSAPKHGKQAGWFARASDAFVDGLLAGYRVSLDFVLRHRFIALLLTFATGYLAVSLYVGIPKGFFPDEDTGFLRGITEAQSDTSFREMAARQIGVSHLIEGDPAVDSVTSAVGFGGATNRGFLFMRLKDKDKRDSMEVVMNRLRATTATVPGIRTILMPVQNLDFTGGRIARAKYQYTLQSGDIDALYSKAPQMERAMAQLPGLRDVNSDLQITNPQWRVDIDREKAAAFGVTADAVRTALYDAFGTRQISTIFTEADDYEVILEASDKFQNDPGALGRIRVATPTGQLVPLDEVATMRRTVGPLQINRQSQQPAVTISFNLAPDMSLGQAIEAIHAVERKVDLPASVITGFAGNAQLFEQALAGQGALLMAAVLTIYILLGVLYESYIHPITILSGLPSAGIGALLALSYFHMDLSVIAIIGILLLIGIVKKNAIMMVDFALERRREGGMDALAAIREAALIRFRPIIMTTLAALLGALADRAGRRRRVGAAPAARRRDRRRPMRLAIADALHHAGRLLLPRQDRLGARRPAPDRAQARRGESRETGRGGRVRRRVSAGVAGPAAKALPFRDRGGATSSAAASWGNACIRRKSRPSTIVSPSWRSTTSGSKSSMPAAAGRRAPPTCRRASISSGRTSPTIACCATTRPAARSRSSSPRPTTTTAIASTARGGSSHANIARAASRASNMTERAACSPTVSRASASIRPTTWW